MFYLSTQILSDLLKNLFKNFTLDSKVKNQFLHDVQHCGLNPQTHSKIYVFKNICIHKHDLPLSSLKVPVEGFLPIYVNPWRCLHVNEIPKRHTKTEKQTFLKWPVHVSLTLLLVASPKVSVEGFPPLVNTERRACLARSQFSQNCFWFFSRRQLPFIDLCAHRFILLLLFWCSRRISETNSERPNDQMLHNTASSCCRGSPFLMRARQRLQLMPAHALRGEKINWFESSGFDGTQYVWQKAAVKQECKISSGKWCSIFHSLS